MKKKILIFFLVFICTFNLSYINVYAEPTSLSDFTSYLGNLTYTDNSWLPDTYLDGTYNNYAVFYIRSKGSSSVTSATRYLYIFCYNDTFGIFPFYYTENSSSDTGYYLHTVTQYSSSNLSSVYGKWYYCKVEDSPSVIEWTACNNSVSGFSSAAINCYFENSKAYKILALNYNYTDNTIVRFDGSAQSYADRSNHYTLYTTYLFGTANIYTDETLTTVYYDDERFDFYGDIKKEISEGSDVDYGSGGVFSWIADFFKSLIDKVVDLPSNIFNLFKSLLNSIVSIVTNIFNAVVSLPQTIIELLSDLLEFLFSPDDEFLSGIKDEFMDNFYFAFQIIDLGSKIEPVFTSSDDVPTFDITLYGSTMSFIDFSMFAQYRTFIHSIIIAIAYYKFIIWLLRSVPSVLHGFGKI